MSSDQRERLKGIRTFPSLIKYLRDELDWPIESDDFEELTFEYTPEELGIDAANAAKIQDIKRLRPLSANQPWGIFFVKFEPKRLPVVALRRVLSRVAVKKRASANSVERAAWQADDLLFVSNYGEGEERRICFAHFSQDPEKKDLPTLKVLGWDNLDTALHLDHVADVLSDRLTWPDDERDCEGWRETWRSAFILRHREVINTSRVLAIKLAELARAIRARINTVLAIETEDGPVTKLMIAFRETLIHNLDEDSFADMYAQTIAYGLLSARIGDPLGVSADSLSLQVPITNPFLKEVMETFIDVGGRKRKERDDVDVDFDELGSSEVVELLNDANMEAVVRDFRDRNPDDDPVTHFYELFLNEYDQEEKKRRGAFYTPWPVVSFIVRSIDEILRIEFGLEYGLADTTTWGEMAKLHKGLNIPKGVKSSDVFIQILDPATGTGTFLVEVINIVYKTMTEKWKANGYNSDKIKELWNDYVQEHLLPRLHGYELMMAPYAIAHITIGLKLKETGYSFGSDERARVYLTNALEPAQDFSGTLAFAIPALAHEADAVNAVKRDQRFTVVIGNPPYAGLSSNLTSFTDALLKQELPTPSRTQGYYTIDGEPLGEKKVWLQDDYVKFLRLGQWQLERTDAGVIGFITNHGFLDNPTFRGMRQSLLSTFNTAYVCDLHGNLKKKERSKDNDKDEGVFDIQQGVAISLFCRWGDPIQRKTRRSDVFGDRGRKYRLLSTTTAFTTPYATLSPCSPFYFLTARNESGRNEFESFPSLFDIMPRNVTGIVTARDSLVINENRETLYSVIKDLQSEVLSDSEVRAKYFSNKKPGRYVPGDSRGWKLPDARQSLRSDKGWNKRHQRVLYRPFDVRYIYYVSWMVDWPRSDLMPQMTAGNNYGLTVGRQGQVIGSEQWDIAFCSRYMTEFNMFRRGGNNLFPLYLYPVGESNDLFSTGQWPAGKAGRVPNLVRGIIKQLEKRLEMTFVTEGSEGTRNSFGPEDLLSFIYSVLFSPSYRIRYKSFLDYDFTRITLTETKSMFWTMADCCRKLMAINLMESPKLDEHIMTLVGSGNFLVEKVSYSDETVWIDKAKTRGFRGVPEEVWNFHVGGYQVCNKWLKDRQAKGGKNPRPGRMLTDEDIDHYQKIVVAFSETIRIMKEIDEVIEKYGGWPGAFQVESKKQQSYSTYVKPRKNLKAAEEYSSYDKDKNDNS